MLEMIDKGSCSEAHPTPLLFVHGAWHAAWCWDEHFLDFFADKGYRGVALSLRGHGGSSASKPIRFVSLADYVEDVVTVAESMPTPPIDRPFQGRLPGAEISRDTSSTRRGVARIHAPSWKSGIQYALDEATPLALHDSGHDW
jgi:hypothetical protein